MINKILIVLLPVAAILIGILYYSNQKAEAPILENAESYNQYIADLIKLPEGDTTFLAKHSYQQLYHSLHFYMTRMWVFRDEKKISKESHDVFYDNYLQAYTNAFDQKTENFLSTQKQNWTWEQYDAIKEGTEWLDKDGDLYKRYNTILGHYRSARAIPSRVNKLSSKNGADELIREISTLEQKEYLKNVTSIKDQLANSKRLAGQMESAINMLHRIEALYQSGKYAEAGSKLNELKRWEICSDNIYLKREIESYQTKLGVFY